MPRPVGTVWLVGERCRASAKNRSLAPPLGGGAAPAVSSRRGDARYRSRLSGRDSANKSVVARGGFEPPISALKGRRPGPLDERAALSPSVGHAAATGYFPRDLIPLRRAVLDLPPSGAGLGPRCPRFQFLMARDGFADVGGDRRCVHRPLRLEVDRTEVAGTRPQPRSSLSQAPKRKRSVTTLLVTPTALTTFRGSLPATYINIPYEMRPVSSGRDRFGMPRRGRRDAGQRLRDGPEGRVDRRQIGVCASVVIVPLPSSRGVDRDRTAFASSPRGFNVSPPRNPSVRRSRVHCRHYRERLPWPPSTS